MSAYDAIAGYVFGIPSTRWMRYWERELIDEAVGWDDERLLDLARLVCDAATPKQLTAAEWAVESAPIGLKQRALLSHGIARVRASLKIIEEATG